MSIDQRQHETSDVLNEKPEYGQTLRILRLLHLNEWAKFW